MLFGTSIIQFATVYDKTNEIVFPFCWEISMTYYCKSIAILLRNSAILLTYCSIEYCNSAIPQHYCYCFVQYSEKLLTVSLLLKGKLWFLKRHSLENFTDLQSLICKFYYMFKKVQFRLYRSVHYVQFWIFGTYSSILVVICPFLKSTQFWPNNDQYWIF